MNYLIDKIPLISNNTITLRKLLLSDIDNFIINVNNPKISDQIINIPFPYSEDDFVFRLNFINEAVKKSERYIFAITYNANHIEDEVIGEIGIHLDKSNNKAEIGYWIAEKYWGRGIATIAVNEIIKFGFESLNLNKIFATHYLNNPASGKVLIKNGMQLEGEFYDHYKINNEYKSVKSYGITKKQYSSL